MSWELRKQIESDETLREINRIARPVGILLFGAEGPLKNRVCDEIIAKVQEIGGCNVSSVKLNVESLSAPLKSRKNVFVILGNDLSTNPKTLEQAADRLRVLGARVIVGVCAIDNEDPPNEHSKTVNKYLQNNPPSIGSLDYLIIVNE